MKAKILRYEYILNVLHLHSHHLVCIKLDQRYVKIAIQLKQLYFSLEMVQAERFCT
jgi:hypothetical protein